MLRAVVAAFVFLVTTSMTSNAASAGIIPCTGQSLIKVLDIYYPKGVEGRHINALREQRIHLGYLFNGCFKGEWVGYVAADKPAVPLSDPQLRAMLFIAGMNELPPPPSYWASPENHSVGMMWLIVGLFILIFAVLQQMGFLSNRKAAVDDPLAEPIPGIAPLSAATAAASKLPSSYQSALVAVERAASQHTRVAIAGSVQAPREAEQSHHTQARRFGKR